MTKKHHPEHDISDDAAEASKESSSQSKIREALEHPTHEALEAKLTEAEEKANDYWNQYLRLQAEMENVRRRSERDVANAHKYALEKFVNELLAVVDSLERGINGSVIEHEAYKSMREGMELTLTMLLKVLEKHGVKQIDPMGQPFNPELHQAVSAVPDAKATPNTVVQVLQKGYTLNDRLLRPALVVVAK